MSHPAPSAPVRIAHQQTCTGQFPTGHDIHFALRASAAALGKVAGIHGRGPPLSEGATVAERCTAERQGSSTNSATVQRTGIESRMTFRQQYSVLRQRGGAGRGLPLAVICPCVVSVSLATVTISRAALIWLAVSCVMFFAASVTSAGSQFFILLSDSAAGGQAEVLVAVKRSLLNDISPAADAQVTSRFAVAG